MEKEMIFVREEKKAVGKLLKDEEWKLINCGRQKQKWTE